VIVDNASFYGTVAISWRHQKYKYKILPGIPGLGFRFSSKTLITSHLLEAYSIRNTCELCSYDAA